MDISCRTNVTNRSKSRIARIGGIIPSIALLTSTGWLFLMLGCDQPTEPSISMEDLLTAPECVEVDSLKFVLGTFVSRDFMPESEPGGSELRVFVEITEIDSLHIPDYIDTDSLWVIYGEQVWETGFLNIPSPRPSFRLQKWACCGPKWGPDVFVEVIVRLVVRNETWFLLKASNQPIHRTD